MLFWEQIIQIFLFVTGTEYSLPLMVTTIVFGFLKFLRNHLPADTKARLKSPAITGFLYTEQSRILYMHLGLVLGVWAQFMYRFLWAT